MKYKTEITAVKMAVKRTMRKGPQKRGFPLLKNF